MKNIHILPTNKPSRLYEGNLGKPVTVQSASAQLKKPLNIYITNSEEIKEGDWMIRDNEQPIKVTKDFFWDFGVKYYKIILTTDQELIDDGVQSIDDEFLEWFVKNSSCERVEVKNMLQVRHGIDWHDLPNQKTGNEQDGIYRNVYKIIIPKEELNQEKEVKKFAQLNIAVVSGSLPSDEEIRDGADEWVFDINGMKWSNNDDTAGDNYGSFIAGAKWQQERMYSENDLKEAFKQSRRTNIFEIGMPLVFDSFEDWFKQYKK